MLILLKTWRTMFFTLIVLFITFLKVHSACDAIKGCYPAVFDILDNFSSFPARSISASSTCGSNSSTPEQYQSVIGANLNTYTCQPTAIQPIKVVDAESYSQPTYWQSDKMVDANGETAKTQFIVFNFTDEFLFHGIIIKFMALHMPSEDISADARPRAFSIEKLDSTTQNWTTLQHFALNCTKSFPGIPMYDPYSPDPDFTRIQCKQHATADSDQFDDYDNELEYSPALRYDNFDNQYKNNITAAGRYTVSAIRLLFIEPASNIPMKSYIAISDIMIDVQCKCNGHADSCVGQNNATCSCQHNTSGQQCHSCLPLFNNRTWTIGTTTDAGVCLACSCNNRATSCNYDQVKGHGVCNNCTGNSTGDACDTCVNGFYINPIYIIGSTAVNTTAAPISIDANNSGDAFCLACSCNQDGTQTTTLSTCNVTTGQCVCKERVTLRDCSACQDTFWGLSANNSLGCNACTCNPQGSLGSINMCNKTTGTCMCKSNVEGDTCNKCKPNTYNFDPNNPDGCTQCDCDPGASTSSNCDVVSGQCVCYDNIGGRDCRSPLTSYFVPRLDALVLEPERFTTQDVTLRSGHGSKDATVSGRGFVKLTSANKINITFTSSLTADVDVVLRFEVNPLRLYGTSGRYMGGSQGICPSAPLFFWTNYTSHKTTSDNFIFLQGKLSLKSGAGYNCQNGQIIPVGKEWTLVFNAVMDDSRGGGIMGKVCLYSGAIYNIQITNPSSALLVDSVVFLLDTKLIMPTIRDPLNVDNATRCVQSAVDTVRSARDQCAQIEYSLVTALLQKAVACSCVGGAFTSTSCNSYNGDCNCLPGVITPDCTQCLVDHYQFSAQVGCTACGCHINGSVSDHCDEQGVCQCFPNVQGATCDSCIPEYTGLHTGRGCTACQCNKTYSINNNCSDYAECACLPGVGGLTCDSCQRGYYNLTTSGCIKCACDQDGSTEQTCDIMSGNCQCLLRTEGNTCSQCKPGFFGLGKWHNEGCISCFCWGHGNNCSSSNGWYDAPIKSLWPASHQIPLGEMWLAEDINGTEINVQTPVVISVNTQQYVMRIDETQRGSFDIFYSAPTKFLGDRKSSYGRFLNIVLKPSQRNSLLTVNTEMNMATVAVKLTGQFSNVTLIYTYTYNLTSSAEIVINIQVSETKWQAVTTTTVGNTSAFTEYNTATYNQLIEVLGSLSSLKILAYQADMPNSAMDLLSVTLDSAVDGSESSDHLQMEVNNVEICVCELGYMSSSCEQCAQHYTRAITNSTNPSFFCVPCECNGHGITQCNETSPNCSVDSVRSCDPLTGICNCHHNTEGDHCETCLPGYYGDPRKGTKDDCLPCACPGVIVANETNVFATSCIQNLTNEPVCLDCQIGHAGNQCELCVDGYFGTPENATNFGGACRPCECNDRADTCNTRSGECVACTNNTAGHNCEICAPGYFGDAMNLTCQLCSCNLTGSTGECDHVTGACECLLNVSGALCDVCDDETFNLTEGVGCQPCNCFTNGSTSLICNKTSGQCPCTNLVTGQHCNECLLSYWNVNILTGCDACQCNPNGTFVENGTAVTSCDVITGQCTCALPGIVGRTCDQCSAVSKNTFEYVNLIYIGSYPNCELCGECFDSWALQMEEIGQDLAVMNKTVHEIWNTYDFQTAEQVSSSLTAIEEKINNMTQFLKEFEGVARQLTDLQKQFLQTLAKHDVISSEIDMLSQTERTLSITLNSLLALTDVVQVTNTTMIALTTLRQQFDKLSLETTAMTSQGNASWIHIQSLLFVVSTPEDREKQLHDQVAKLMETAAYANQTLLLMKTLYETSLTPGVKKNAQELANILERIANISVALADVRSTIISVQNDISNSKTSLTSLSAEAAVTRDKMLNHVLSLQVYATNASRSQKAAEKLLADVRTFETVAEKAEQTIINSTTTLLEYIAILEQAQNDLTEALSMSTESLAVEIPSEATMQLLVDQIRNTTLSDAEVADLKMSSQQAKFTADQSVMLAQRALSLSKDLNEELTMMNSDIVTSRDLRAQAQALHLASDGLNSSIHSVLQQARNHSDMVSSDITLITQSAVEMQAKIKNVTLCLSQKQLDVTNTVTAANQLKEKADSASSNQIQLLNKMLQINSYSLADVSQTLSKATQADSVIKQANSDLEQIEALAQLQALIQELQAQNLEIDNLDQEITQLTSQLDSIILVLQESSGETKCNSK